MSETWYTIEWTNDSPCSDRRRFESEEKADAFILELKASNRVEHIWKTKNEKIK